ncbi:hypothetical protein Tco_0368436 [Tanacetum coccineum]
MAASSIVISSDSSDESVGSPPSRVILFGDIPTVIPSTYVVAPETSTIAPVISSAAHVVEMTLVALPIRLCGLVPYSGSDSDSPDEMTLMLLPLLIGEMSSPEHLSPLPAISLFLCTDSSEAPDSSDRPPSQDPYVATIARWRSRVTARPSSLYEFPIAPVTAPPEICRRSAILIQPREAIPFGRPYRTHLNGPRKLLTVRKRVGHLPARILAWRHASPCFSDHHLFSSSSYSDSLPVHSSGLDAPDQAHSCAALLSTLYPPTTSESSSGDSLKRPPHLSSPSGRPSRKRCRSLVASVASSTPVIGSLSPTRADLLPSRKRFRDSYSFEASIEEDTKINPIETEVDMELDIGIDRMSAPIVEEEIGEPAGKDSSDLYGTRDGIVRSFKDMPIDLDDVVRDFYHYMSERVSMIERIDSLSLENLKVRAMMDIERDRVDSLRLYMSLSQEELHQVCRDRDDTQERLRRTMTNTRSDLELGNGNANRGGDGNGNGTGNGNNGGDKCDGNENHNVNGRGDRPGARECTYQDFIKCQPLSFNGTKGMVGLIRWSEKMETVFHINNYLERYQVKYATCTLLDSALTWWNSHKRTIKTDAAYTLS